MSNPVNWSLRAYRRLLCLYPPGFRSAYGEEMTRVFGDVCREGYRRQGGRGVAGVWVETAPDMLTSVLDEHAQEDFVMARTQLARVLSIGGFVAGALWITYGVLANMRSPGIPNGPYRELEDIGILFIAGLPFLGVSMIATYLRLAAAWPMSTKLALLMAPAGVLWMLALSPIAESWWLVFFAGYLLMALGLLLTGGLLFVRHAMQTYAALFAGIGFCCLLFNTEDMRVLFAAAAGILIIALSALVFQGMPNRQGEPPLSA